MKLRNKKTGEIIDIKDTLRGSDDYPNHYLISSDWEDYEEPEELWFIAHDGSICSSRSSLLTEEWKKLGLTFETKEEAEKAVEKLKAWKRLKDRGFVFCGKGDCLDTIKFDYGLAGYNIQDFNLLFGGEE